MVRSHLGPSLGERLRQHAAAHAGPHAHGWPLHALALVLHAGPRSAPPRRPQHAVHDGPRRGLPQDPVALPAVHHGLVEVHARVAVTLASLLDLGGRVVGRPLPHGALAQDLAELTPGHAPLLGARLVVAHGQNGGAAGPEQLRQLLVLGGGVGDHVEAGAPARSAPSRAPVGGDAHEGQVPVPDEVVREFIFQVEEGHQIWRKGRPGTWRPVSR